MTIDITLAKAEDFDPYVGDSFTVQTADGSIELKLDNVKRHNPETKRPMRLEIDGKEIPPREPFALTFEGPLQPVLSQMIYKIDHEKIGQLDLFLSPFMQEADATLYESMFT